MATPAMTSSSSPPAALDPSPTPPPSDPKSDRPSLPDAAAAAPDPSPTPPPSDPSSDRPSLPDAVAAAADQPAPSVPPVVPVDGEGESSNGEGTEGAEVEGKGKGDGEVEEEEEEEEECGFCLFMKSGGCKDTFVAWENCVESAEKSGEDIVEKCAEMTGLLKKCMDDHAEYYAPILRADKAMAEVAQNEQKENAGTEEKNEGKTS